MSEGTMDEPRPEGGGEPRDAPQVITGAGGVTLRPPGGGIPGEQ